jgi:hypothetical protein
VTVTGQAFDTIDQAYGALLCEFGVVGTAPAFVINATALWCQVPPVDAASLSGVRVPLNLTWSGIVLPSYSWSAAMTFTFLPVPQVVSLSPARGFVSGGTVAAVRTVDGQLALLPRTACIVCGFSSANATAPTATVVAVIASLATDTNTFLCQMPPALSVLTGYASVAALPWNSAAVPVVPVVLWLSYNGVDFTPTHVQFYYQATVSVTSVFPLAGSELGGTVLKLTVPTALVQSPQLACRFGMGAAAVTVPAHMLTLTIAQCVTPPSLPGTYRVTSAQIFFTLNGVDFIATPFWFSYLAPLQVLGIWPARGDVHGNTTLQQLHLDKCRLGAPAAAAASSPKAWHQRACSSGRG